MKRDAFRRLLKEDRPAAVVWLADQIFDTYDLEDLQNLWREFHLGETPLRPLCSWQLERLMEIANETVTWD